MSLIIFMHISNRFLTKKGRKSSTQQQWDMVLFWGGQIAPVLKHKKAALLMQALIEETTHQFSSKN